jgi:hypothetical protein
MNDSNFDMMMQGQYGLNQQPPFYSYRSNSSGNMQNHQTASGVFDQTLLAPTPNNNNGDVSNGAFTDASASNNGSLNSVVTDQGDGFGFEENTNMFHFDNIDSFTAFSSLENSVQATPGGTDVWPNSFDNDMFHDLRTGAPA